jgi:hypothetical protein
VESGSGGEKVINNCKRKIYKKIIKRNNLFNRSTSKCFKILNDVAQ